MLGLLPHCADVISVMAWGENVLRRSACVCVCACACACVCGPHANLLQLLVDLRYLSLPDRQRVDGRGGSYGELAQMRLQGCLVHVLEEARNRDDGRAQELVVCIHDAADKAHTII
jgi:hypothetical protein